MAGGSRSLRLGRLAIAVVALLSLGPDAGLAEARSDGDLTRAEVASLAEAAMDDRGARRELGSVRSIDGRPFDAAQILDATAEDRSERLADLARLLDADAEGPSPGADDPAQARDDAERILEDQRFRERDVPRPFRGAMRWIGDRLSDLYAPIERLLEPVIGAGAVPYAVLLAFLGIAAAVSRRLVGSRSRAAVATDRGSALIDPSADPSQLEAAAERASESGDHGRAVRLRHEAGLIRLVRSGRLDLRPDMTARDAAEAVGDRTLDDLTDLFEEVVYGGRSAGGDDDARSAAGWPRVLGERVR